MTICSLNKNKEEEEVPVSLQDDNPQIDCTHELYSLYLHLRQVDRTWLAFKEKGGNGKEEEKGGNGKEEDKVVKFKVFKVCKHNFRADCSILLVPILEDFSAYYLFSLSGLLFVRKAGRGYDKRP